jgi:RimJ/RimL family protein N-acetyltransferase
MRPHIEAWPENLPPQAAGDVARLDRLMFEGDPPSELSGRWWWIVRDKKGNAIAFAGMRACQLKVNEGIALLTRAGVVLPYRGKGIHQAMIAARINYARRKGFREAVSYVIGKNYASCNALTASGFRLYEPSERYAGDNAFYFRIKLTSRAK